MDQAAILTVTWACIALFVATGIVTLLALVGRVTLGGGDGSKHDFYLKALFTAIVLEIVGISLTAYALKLKGSGLIEAPKNMLIGVGATTHTCQLRFQSTK